MERAIEGQLEPELAGSSTDRVASPQALGEPCLARLMRGVARRLWLRADRNFARRTMRRLGVDHAWSIPTWTSADELLALFNLASLCPTGARALELGSHLGASTCFLAAGLALRGGELTCIDTWRNDAMPDEPRDTYEEFLRNVAPLRDRLRLIRTRTDQIDSSRLGGPFSLIFIDADHAPAAVQFDFNLAAGVLAPGGCIAMHDSVAFPGVRAVIGRALSDGDWCIAGTVENLLWLKRLPGTDCESAKS